MSNRDSLHARMPRRWPSSSVATLAPGVYLYLYADVSEDDAPDGEEVADLRRALLDRDLTLTMDDVGCRVVRIPDPDAD